MTNKEKVSKKIRELVKIPKEYGQGVVEDGNGNLIAELRDGEIHPHHILMAFKKLGKSVLIRTDGELKPFTKHKAASDEMMEWGVDINSPPYNLSKDFDNQSEDLYSFLADVLEV